jgi:Ca-activated chloride channel homolog
VTFLSPGYLWLLLVPILLAIAYTVVQLRRRHHAARFTNLALLDRIAPRRPGWRRHLAAGVLLAGLLVLVVAISRPAVEEQVAREQATIVLAMDVSASMSATDVEPDRITVAIEAADEFAGNLRDRTRLGLISFAETARVLVAPTTDREAVRRAIDGLQLEYATATGEAIFAALTTLQTDGALTQGTNGDGTGDPTTSAAQIVLMSDGYTTTGRPVDEAVAAAVEAGVPVTTIAYGTDQGRIMTPDGPADVPVDRATLRNIAEQTGGTFYEAATGQQLDDIYNRLGTAPTSDVEQREITAVFTTIGALLVVLAAVGALIWTSRLV